MASRSSRGRHPAGRVVGRVQEDGARPWVSGQEVPHVLGPGPEPVLDLEGNQDRASLPALQVGNIRGKVRTEHQDAVARVDQGLGEVLLEWLRSRGHHDILRTGRIAELGGHERGGRLAESRQPQARTVAGLVLLDRLDAGGLGVRSAGKWAVADLQFHHVLAPPLQAPRQGQHRECRLGRQVLRDSALNRTMEILLILEIAIATRSPGPGDG